MGRSWPSALCCRTRLQFAVWWKEQGPPSQCSGLLWRKILAVHNFEAFGSGDPDNRTFSSVSGPTLGAQPLDNSIGQNSATKNPDSSPNGRQNHDNPGRPWLPNKVSTRPEAFGPELGPWFMRLAIDKEGRAPGSTQAGPRGDSMNCNGTTNMHLQRLI